MRIGIVVLSGFLLVACGGGSGDDVDAAGGGGDAGGDASGGGVDAGGGGGVCPVTGFTACGGELSGTWSIREFCPADPEAAAALFEHPFSDTPECADRTMNTVDGVLVHTGTIAFDGTNVQMNITEEAHVTYGFTSACLAAVYAKSTAQEACDELGSRGTVTCTFVADFCTCSGVVPGEPSSDSVPYTLTDATTVSIDGVSAAYCVDEAGTGLTLDFAEHPVSWRYWVLERD